MLRLQGAKTFLQEFTADRLQDETYFAWLRDLEVVKGIYRLEYLLPLEREEITSYVRNVMASKNDFFFSLHEADSGAFIGTVKLGHIDWRTGTGDVGILIGDGRFRGQGLAKDAIRTLASYAFGPLSLRKLTGGTASGNAPMIRSFENLNFRREGALRRKLLINGAYEDHLLFGLFRDEFEGPAS